MHHFLFNNESINLKDMMLRELLGASLLEGGMIIIPTYLRKMLPLFKLSMIVDPLKYIAYALTIGSIIYAYFQANTQSFHDKVAKTLEMFSKEYDFEELIPISALKGKNVDSLVKLMVNKMPEGPQYYPEDMITDVQERFIVAEIVREKALKNLRDEVPHGIAVDVIQMKQNEKGTYHIEVDLICEKDSHKGIIIGKNGASLKKIGETSRYEIERFLRAKINLKIWVKVRKEWRDNGLLLRELGYKKNK